MSDPRRPDDGPNWPERDLDRDEQLRTGSSGELEFESQPDGRGHEPVDPYHPYSPPPREPEPEPVAPPQEGPTPTTESGEPTTAFEGAQEAWNPKVHGNRRQPTTAEQAVPWLIGISLALAGIVIVLLALIFTSPGGLIGDVSNSPSPTPIASATGAEPSLAPSAAPSQPEPTATPQPTEEPTAAPSPTPAPEYGPLEMVFLGRPSALAPVYLLRRDFSTATEPAVMAQADQGVTRYAWAPDGTVGAAVINNRAVALTPGQAARALADNVTAMTFGWDSSVLYGVRIVRDGANDRAEILQIDFASGASETLASITYPHPAIGPDPALKEAQFIDDGGTVRIYAVADGNLAVWILGAPAIYRVDPGDGRVSNIGRQPILWAPDGSHRITLFENANGSTVIGLRDRSGTAVSTVSVSGLVSHVRWAKDSNEIVFTLGQLGAGGGVRQNLYVWDLVDGKAPMAMTSNGASFGAEWLGVMPNWLP